MLDNTGSGQKLQVQESKIRRLLLYGKHGRINRTRVEAPDPSIRSITNKVLLHEGCTLAKCLTLGAHAQRGL